VLLDIKTSDRKQSSKFLSHYGALLTELHIIFVTSAIVTDHFAKTLVANCLVLKSLHLSSADNCTCRLVHVAPVTLGPSGDKIIIISYAAMRSLLKVEVLKELIVGDKHRAELELEVAADNEVVVTGGGEVGVVGSRMCVVS
jgi:hypothetical protein